MKDKIKCSHFGYCGGCFWQDLSYQEQLERKVSQVKKELRAFSLPKLEPIVPSPKVWFYRNKMEYVFGREGERLVLGLRPRGQREKIVDLKECPLFSPQAGKIFDFFRQFFQKRKILPYSFRKEEGYLRHLVVREGKNTNQLMINLVTFPGKLEGEKELVEGLKNSFPNLKTFLHTYCSRRADVVDPEEVRIIYGEGYFEEILGKYIFRISPFSFFQPNPFQALNLYQLVKEWVGEGNNLVIDLYSGSGGISVFVAPGNKEVLGVELLEEAVKDAYLNLRLNKITNCRFITGNVKEVLRSLLPRLSSFPVTMIVDPPRAGVPKKVIYQILSLAPEKIIYLSCNLKTLASCLQNFLKFYKIFSLRSVDMFPQTPHQEVVLLLERKSKS